MGDGNILDVVVKDHTEILIGDKFDTGPQTSTRDILKILNRRPEKSEYRKGYDWVQMLVTT